MRTAFLIAAISALAWARPETYKEREDFQYSRSSSDEGSKSGFYGAQRGNMGGNYEKAHNMDSLAQNQMSGAVRQVEGELGDASKTRTGSVFTAANSRGIYGSGNYDLSNLHGRNFAESSSSHDTHSSLSANYNQNSQNSDWRSQQSSGLSASNQFGQAHAADDINGIYSHGLTHFGKSYDHSSGYQSQSGYHAQSGYQGGSAYDQLSSNTHAGSFGTHADDQTQRRYIVTPVKIVGRPGTQVAVPVFAQAYDAQKSSALNENSINTEAEVLNNNQQHVSGVPLGHAKHYESSYDYRKAWERHSESNPSNIALAVPTVNPFPKNSELNEDAQVSSGFDGQQHSNGYNRHNSYVQSGSSQSRHQSEHRSDLSSSSSNAYNQGAHGSLTGSSGSLSGDVVDSQPKSYQSAYSYHKAWERQGDPYVIYPATNGGTKTSASASSSHQQYRHQHAQGNALDCDCDEYGHLRAKRSYHSGDNSESQDLGQQTQEAWHGSYQQAQNKLESLEDLGQQTQQTWGNFEQQIRPEKLEDLGQQTQETWHGAAQQTQNKVDGLQDLGQQIQQTWGNFEQQIQPEKLQDLGQQTQETWQGAGQQTQNKLDSLQDLGQQTQPTWGKFEQQIQPEKLQDLDQQTQQTWGNFEQQIRPEKLEDLGQQTQETWREAAQQTQNKHDSLQDLGQQTQQSWGKFEQQNRPEKLEDLGQQSQHKFGNLENQQTQSKLDDFSNLGQQSQQSLHIKDFTEQQSRDGNIEDLGQQTQHKWDSMENFGQQFLTHWGNADKNRDTTGTEQQTQMHAHSVDQMKDDRPPVWHNTNTQHILDNTDYYHNPNHTAFWGALNQHSYSNVHSHSNSQKDGVNWQEASHKTEEQTTENNPLQSLWDKIDNLEEQSEHSSYDGHDSNKFTGYESSQDSYYGHRSTYHYDSASGVVSTSINGNQHQTHYNEHKPLLTINGTEKTVNNTNRLHGHKDGNHETINADIPEIVEASEVGRGDIGADDSQSDKTSPKIVPVPETILVHTKPEKSPELIEALSLSRGTERSKNVDNSDTDSLAVISLNQQKWLHDQRQTASDDLQKTNDSSVTFNRTHPLATTNENTKFSENNFDKHLIFENSSSHDFGQHNQHIDQQNLHQFETQEQIDQQNTWQQSDRDFGQQTQDLNQQNLQHFESQNQQNIGQQLQDFGQQSQDLSQQSLQQFETSGKFEQNVDQQHTGQELKDFGQQSRDLGQQHLEQFDTSGKFKQNLNQQITGQQLEDFVQQSQDLSQQSLQQSETSGKFEQNLDQQHTGQELKDLGQQSQDLGQQYLEQFDTSGKFKQNLNQQITGQQLEDFGQQSQDLTQQDLQQFKNVDQQSENVYQHGAWKEASNFNDFNRNTDKNDMKPGNLNVPTNSKEVNEEKIVGIEIPASQSNPKEEVEIPAIPPTEKPGFWKSIGSKLTSAKDSVSSWFKRS